MIGLAVGLAAAAGLLAAAAVSGFRGGVLLAPALAAAAGGAVAWIVADPDWSAVPAAAAGAACALAGAELLRGTLRRGGTRGGTGILLAGAALGAAAAALIPFVGYLEAVVLPALALRLRRRGGERYAGLRILARD